MANFKQFLTKILIVGLGLEVSGSTLSQAQSVIDNELSPYNESREERLIEGMDQGIQKNYRGAIAIFSEVIQQYPDYADAYFNRGIARAKLQDYQGAIADQTQAIELNPQLAEAYQARAKLYWQLGDRQEARDDLQIAINLYELHQNVISQHQAEQLIKQWQEE